jgi:hypothetical protein
LFFLLRCYNIAKKATIAAVTFFLCFFCCAAVLLSPCLLV